MTTMNLNKNVEPTGNVVVRDRSDNNVTPGDLFWDSDNKKVLTSDDNGSNGFVSNTEENDPSKLL